MVIFSKGKREDYIQKLQKIPFFIVLDSTSTKSTFQESYTKAPATLGSR